MLTVDEARALVIGHVRPLADERVALEPALGRVLAAPVVALHDVPPFDNSAMDGFAATAGPPNRTLSIVGESRAGAPFKGTVRPGEAVRISTGAPFPDGADGVMPVERTTEPASDAVTFLEALQPGRNVRAAGDDVAEGVTLLASGTVLGAAELGVAASGGHGALRCVRRPRVVILTTGDELVAPGRPLGPGQIHEANMLTLRALASSDGADVLRTEHVPDGREATGEAIGRGLEDADLLLLSGGVSVGPHDHVKPALDDQGVSEVFWRVALRPGGPMWCGTHRNTLVLGLPGNPVSTMVTYLLFGRTAIRRMQGLDPRAAVRRVQLTEGLERMPDRDEFVRVTLAGDRATPTGAQDSNRLTSMLGADGLARIPAGHGRVEAGALVDVELVGAFRVH
jgi:molybdopterin molybdotransferase